MNHFIGKIFYSLFCQNDRKNFCFCSASLLDVLGTLSICVSEKNLNELLYCLNFNKTSVLQQIENYKKLLDFDVSDFFYYSDEYSKAINKDVVSVIKNLGNTIESISFQNLGDAVSKINNTVFQKTQKINNLVSQNDLTEFTKFIILNCLCFEKNWKNKFTISLIKEKFFANNIKEIYFLNRIDYFALYEDNYLSIIEIPYENSDICCYIFLPRHFGVFDLINGFNAYYEKIEKVNYIDKINLKIPSFKIESRFDLSDTLIHCGLENIFTFNKDWKLIDFHLLLPDAKIALEKIIQKTYFEFAESGTKALATTVATIDITGCFFGIVPPTIRQITINKPFVFVLANKNNKSQPIFMGVVNDVDDINYQISENLNK